MVAFRRVKHKLAGVDFHFPWNSVRNARRSLKTFFPGLYLLEISISQNKIEFYEANEILVHTRFFKENFPRIYLAVFLTH
ncbi:MAG: hypothetical protein ASUL_08149 [Candidatus Aramenus sulfurataquae]|uniref:Uncharacterized protein n=1 Tax=Candidatus Aramenus sulfurataquae TaxID=1326980 RepID=W7L527_9CREN|nr:MAG: hypothetical protein ASUL_08149 [Candidatus Aramenus sulfurataquae]